MPASARRKVLLPQPDAPMMETNEPAGIAVSPTGPEAGYVYVTNFDDGTVSVITPATNNVAATITVGSEPAWVAVSHTGPEAGDVYVANSDGTVSVISPSSDTVIATITVGNGPVGVAISPSGAYAGDIYVTNQTDGTVSVIN